MKKTTEEKWMVGYATDRGRPIRGCPLIYSKESGYLIAEVTRLYSLKELASNARLIAAAPELLSTGKKLLESCQKGGSALDDAMKALGKAIEKAEGK